MNGLLNTTTGEVISHGRAYEITAYGVRVFDPTTQKDELLLHDQQSVYQVIDMGEAPENFRPHGYRYINGQWELNETGKWRSLIRELIAENGLEGQSLDVVYTKLVLGQVSPAMELVDFFGQCMANGAAVEDFKDIWKYDGFRDGLTEALQKGQANRVRAFIATVPWAVSPQTQNALGAVAAWMSGTLIQRECALRGMTYRQLTLQDLAALLQ